MCFPLMTRAILFSFSRLDWFGSHCRRCRRCCRVNKASLHIITFNDLHSFTWVVWKFDQRYFCYTYFSLSHHIHPDYFSFIYLSFQFRVIRFYFDFLFSLLLLSPLLLIIFLNLSIHISVFIYSVSFISPFISGSIDFSLQFYSESLYYIWTSACVCYCYRKGFFTVVIKPLKLASNEQSQTQDTITCTSSTAWKKERVKLKGGGAPKHTHTPAGV